MARIPPSPLPPPPPPQATTLPTNLTKPETSTNLTSNDQQQPTTSTSTSTPTTRTPALPTPKLLQIHDLRHPSTTTFLTLIPNLASTLETALTTIIQTLYTCPPPQSPPPSASTNPPKTTPITFTPTLPPTRSITTFLRPIPGVAYTTGTDLDADHKEIHLSLAYIASCTERYADSSSSLRAEIVGVLTHELVHCYQHTSPDRDDDTAPKPPGGLIEGIADFVRLKAGLAPPHWQRPRSAAERPEKWDQGYQHTAYFLAWLEEVRVGTGAVGLVNDRLLRVGYVGVEGFWRGLFGVGVEELWEEYGRYLDTLAGEGEER
ncbi:BSP-domain-containing protein [Aspergillus japonicus CBS 114.51]|uniref:BSP-domain-containing protein n=1 Tax=Aspergillus japonicus CBS 114.51 TaxID=1448312 RepID=A0A8T8WRE7_ASPJA|nr:BSP-domain-containing protein [Aspergillus japonicus CBS 114.51]RAH78254.1 BSP-domain-containing protein [Aspergillus japonicus CBS 114.51]